MILLHSYLFSLSPAPRQQLPAPLPTPTPIQGSRPQTPHAKKGNVVSKFNLRSSPNLPTACSTDELAPRPRSMHLNVLPRHGVRVSGLSVSLFSVWQVRLGWHLGLVWLSLVLADFPSSRLFCPVYPLYSMFCLSWMS